MPPLPTPETSSARGSRQLIDVGDMLDEGPWSTAQKLTVLLAAFSIVLDGFNGQLIGFALPSLVREWDVAKGDFSSVVASGLFGMALGSGLAGYAGDRIGRRAAIVASVMTFSLATIAIGLSPDILTLTILRFIAGLGIGGALPIATTFAAEFTPKRLRTIAITGTIVSVPLGGMIAGLFASSILPDYGWRTLFYLGGAIPFLFSLLLLIRMPESPRWLLRQPGQSESVAKLLSKLGRDVPNNAHLVDGSDQPESHGGFSAIFAEGRTVSTLALWAAFFLTLLSVYLAFSWLPTLLTSEGLSIAQAGSGLTAYNLGGVAGAIGCAFAINRFGSRWPLLVCCLGAASSALVLRTLDLSSHIALMTLGFGVHGLFVNAVQSTLYAVAANLYPTDVRASGTAAGLVIGRVGAIVSAFAGTSIINHGGSETYLATLAVAMTGSAVALLLLRDHISSAGVSAAKR